MTEHVVDPGDARHLELERVEEHLTARDLLAFFVLRAAGQARSGAVTTSVDPSVVEVEGTGDGERFACEIRGATTGAVSGQRAACRYWMVCAPVKWKPRNEALNENASDDGYTRPFAR